MSDGGMIRRVVGKRQVRPNLSRSGDFGYVERTRPAVARADAPVGARI